MQFVLAFWGYNLVSEAFTTLLRASSPFPTGLQHELSLRQARTWWSMLDNRMLVGLVGSAQLANAAIGSIWLLGELWKEWGYTWIHQVKEVL